MSDLNILFCLPSSRSNYMKTAQTARLQNPVIQSYASCDPPDARRQHGNKSDQLIGLNHRMPHSSQSRYRVFLCLHFALTFFFFIFTTILVRLHLNSLSAVCIWTHCQQTKTLLVVEGWGMGSLDQSKWVNGVCYAVVMVLITTQRRLLPVWLVESFVYFQSLQ